ncbi:hypothetical protein SNEBB_011293 [Seison nebaliae]|nr:hypothetical protein SNEBB_011293 [Seison nebaliae]
MAHDMDVPIEDHVPSAMESEVYYNGQLHVDGAPIKRKAQIKDEPSAGKKLLQKLRCLWSTREMTDSNADKEKLIRTTLRELILYCIYLCVLVILTFGMTNATMYYYTKVITNLFVNTKNSAGATYMDIATMDDFWAYAKEPLLNGLYWEKWYNDDPVDLTDMKESGFVYFENKLLGVPRLRQVKVHNESCIIHDDFKQEIKQCYDSYAPSIEDKDPFGKKVLMPDLPCTDKDDPTGSAWCYFESDRIDGSKHFGLLRTYEGGGYIANLNRTRADSEEVVDELKSYKWIDRGTRAVFIDFTFYNANINLFSQVRLVIEFPATGGAFPSSVVRTVKLIRYVTGMDYFVLASEILFCLFLIYYSIEEIIEIKRNKCKYFKSVWNILDIVILIIGYIAVTFSLYRNSKVKGLLDNLLRNHYSFPDFEFLGYWETQYNNAVAFAVFLSWIKIFKYISFNKTMTQLSTTLGKCAKDVAGFAVMFFIVFFAFAQLGYLIFGTQIKDFSSFVSSLFTLFRIILGDFDFHALEQANRVLGPIFFLTYVFFVFFVLLNMFLAIINDTYSEVKAEISSQPSEFEIGDYFKKGYNRMLDKLSIRRDKIVDIQKALQSADMNNDTVLDFDEWRTDLKARGYADAEIETLFARYDLDGDRMLNKDEQQRMQEDLKKQQLALNQELDALESAKADQDKQDADRRPDSGRQVSDNPSSNESGAARADILNEAMMGAAKKGPTVNGGVAKEEFGVLVKRADKMEMSIGTLVGKIEAVLHRLESLEKEKLKKREAMTRIMDRIQKDTTLTEEERRKKLDEMIREEMGKK